MHDSFQFVLTEMTATKLQNKKQIENFRLDQRNRCNARLTLLDRWATSRGATGNRVNHISNRMPGSPFTLVGAEDILSHEFARPKARIFSSQHITYTEKSILFLRIDPDKRGSGISPLLYATVITDCALR